MLTKSPLPCEVRAIPQIPSPPAVGAGFPRPGKPTGQRPVPLRRRESNSPNPLSPDGGEG